MFRNVCLAIREAVYGLVGVSQVGPGQVNWSAGTAFMIAPGCLATAAHGVHVRNDPTQPVHTSLEVIRAPDVGQQMERLVFIAEDVERDVALLRLDNPRSTACLTLNTNPAPIGAACGSLGFPLAQVAFTQAGRAFNLAERFQGAYISAFYRQQNPSGRILGFYETDALMYSGSSGCPGFQANAEVFGMHVASIVQRVQSGQEGGQQALPQPDHRLAISLWVPSEEIVSFATSSGVQL